MWLVFAGRLYKEFEKAIGEYSDVKIKGYEMVEDYKGDKDEDVTCIVILDAGLHSLREWKSVHDLSKVYEDIPIVMYIRYEELMRDDDLFKKNVIVRTVGEGIYINALVNEVEGIEKEGIEWGEG